MFGRTRQEVEAEEALLRAAAHKKRGINNARDLVQRMYPRLRRGTWRSGEAANETGVWLVTFHFFGNERTPRVEVYVHADGTVTDVNGEKIEN